MDQKKAGNFFRELRREKGLTQEQLAEHFRVSGRTISRWENGKNMPDLDLLIEMADYYDVELRELIDGERQGANMNKELEETVMKVADYSNDEKMKLMKKLHVFSWIGAVSLIVFMILEAMGPADSELYEFIASFFAGISLGVLFVAIIYTSRHISKIRAFKQRIFRRHR